MLSPSALFRDVGVSVRGEYLRRKIRVTVKFVGRSEGYHDTPPILLYDGLTAGYLYCSFYYVYS